MNAGRGAYFGVGFLVILLLFVHVQQARANTDPTPAATPAYTSSPVTVNVQPPNGWVTFGTASFAVVAAFISASVAWRVATAGVWQKANEEEIKRLQTDLREFYGPFMRLLDVILLMSQDLRARLKEKQPDYRMLLSLTDPNWYCDLPSGDKIIVDEVIANDMRVEALILEKSGGRVDSDIGDYLSHAVAHFRMLKHPKDGLLHKSDMDMLRRYVFPTKLPEIMRLQIEHIEKRINTLQKNPTKPAVSYEPLRLPPGLKAQPWANPARADVNQGESE